MMNGWIMDDGWMDEELHGVWYPVTAGEVGNS